MAPSSRADTTNRASETPSTEAGMGTPEISNSASASTALANRESAPPAKIATLAPAASTPEVERKIARQHAHQGHVDYVGAHRQDAAVLKDQRLNGR